VARCAGIFALFNGSDELPFGRDDANRRDNCSDNRPGDVGDSGTLFASVLCRFSARPGDARGAVRSPGRDAGRDDANRRDNRSYNRPGDVGGSGTLLRQFCVDFQLALMMLVVLIAMLLVVVLAVMMLIVEIIVLTIVLQM